MKNKKTQLTTLCASTAGLLAVLLASQSGLAAPRQPQSQRLQQQRAQQQRSQQLQRQTPELAPPKQEKLVRPTRPAKMEPSQPVIGSEVFVERYEDGKVKIEREVALDDAGNYVNHGPWRMWNQDGKLVAEGSFEYGKRTSIWTRWYDRNDSPLLSQQPFRRFDAPFLSQTHFENDTMDGEWSIFDAQQRRCCQLSIHEGKRHGMSIFWLPDGTVLQQSMFEKGVPTGDVLDLDGNTGKLTQSKHYLKGREMITKKVSYRRMKQLKLEGNFLAPTSVQSSPDDFWNLQFAKYEPQGDELRHGTWQEWYPTGQLKMSGRYDHDKMVGQFSYWHSNGQKAAEGEYLANKHHGTWVWWHQNGQKSVTGSFDKGLLVDDWRWWAENGRLTKQTTQDGTQTFESLASDTEETPKSARTNERRVQR